MQSYGEFLNLPNFSGTFLKVFFSERRAGLPATPSGGCRRTGKKVCHAVRRASARVASVGFAPKSECKGTEFFHSGNTKDVI